jgi:hypothetical protein
MPLCSGLQEKERAFVRAKAVPCNVVAARPHRDRELGGDRQFARRGDIAACVCGDVEEVSFFLFVLDGSNPLISRLVPHD